MRRYAGRTDVRAPTIPQLPCSTLLPFKLDDSQKNGAAAQGDFDATDMNNGTCHFKQV